MVFPFTFTSLLPYPFASSAASSTDSPTFSSEAPQAGPSAHSRRHLPPRPPRRKYHDDSEDFSAFTLQRKRGWEPSAGSPSRATTWKRPVVGDFDTPSKYVGLTDNADSDLFGMDQPDQSDIPPTKRRRLGETIISTALSAALIGTAVGLTAYKLWRDRGKVPEYPQVENPPEQSPPPPYEEDHGWLEAKRLEDLRASPTPSESDNETVQSDLPRKVPHKSRTVPSPRKRATLRPRRAPIKRASPMPSHKPSYASLRTPEPVLMEYPNEEADGADEQMDWMNDRLRGLIEQGKQALGKEIVIQDDTLVSEDQGLEDDGSRDWVDDDEIDGPTPSSYRSRSRAGGLYASSNHLSTTSLASSAPSKGLSRRGSMYNSTSSKLPSSTSMPILYASRVSLDSHPNSIPISASLGSVADRDRFWTHSVAHPIPSPAAVADDWCSGSPELRESMERARRARLGL